MTIRNFSFYEQMIPVLKTKIYHLLTRRESFLSYLGVYETFLLVSGSAACIPMLQEYRDWQNNQKAALGDLWKDENMVFAAWDGRVMRPDTLGSWFSKFIKRHDLPHITLHGLRHTNATLLIAAGTDLRTVANRLGHAQTSTTADIYAHAIQSADAAAAEQINSILTLPKQHKPQANPKPPKLRLVK